MLKRSIEKQIATILLDYRKMAFISGARQVGKTTLAESIKTQFSQSAYFNWDIADDQKKLLSEPYFFEKYDRDPSKLFLLIFDEIHKYSRWKSYLKGAYDKYRKEFCFLITGSGRLDLFKKGGESLLGRYFSVPLFPLTIGELKQAYPTLHEFKEKLNSPEPDEAESYEALFEFSGFPEPFLRNEKAFYNIWSAERKKLLVKEDIRDVMNIRNISLLEMLSHLIPPRVGAPLSINALREDLGVAFETIRDWVAILGQFFYLFQITPYTGSLTRTLKKETKAYLFDWAEVNDESFRFENLVALHLYKAVEYWKATGEGKISLHFLRDKEKREVDFILVEGSRPICLVECKNQDVSPASNLTYFQNKLKVPVAVQLVNKKGVCRKIKQDFGELWIISADRWLGILP